MDTLARILNKSDFHKRSNCDLGVNGFAENESGHYWDEADFSRFQTNGKGFIGFVVQLPGASVHMYISTEMFYADMGNWSQGPE